MSFMDRCTAELPAPVGDGYICLVRGQYPEAIDSFRKAVQGDPENADEEWDAGFTAMDRIMHRHGGRCDVRSAFSRLSSDGYAIASWIMARKAIQDGKTREAIGLCATAYRQGLKEASLCLATLAEYHAPLAEKTLRALEAHPVDGKTREYFNQVLHGDLPYYQGLFYENEGLFQMAEGFYDAACASPRYYHPAALGKWMSMHVRNGGGRVKEMRESRRLFTFKKSTISNPHI